MKEWRRAKGVSVREMAEYLEVSDSTVINWENKGQKIPVEKAIKFCKFLGVDLADVNFFCQ
jgi:transcriptional regulator with XRE-family HTH domain